MPVPAPFSRFRCATVIAALSCLSLFANSAENPPEPAREFRGAWVATVFNIDWPSKPGLAVDTQKAELRNIMDRAQAIGLNAILLQVRPSADALYASKREPWSQFLTGKQGRVPSPAYDPLEFAISEAHARGLELHAWFNPFRALASTSSAVAENHITKTHPEWIRNYGKLVWLDPGDPAARKWSIDTIVDVTKRYDVDGIHIDDYFYPYPIKANGAILPFPDDVTWAAYQKGGGKLNREDWRRDNINSFMRDLYNGIKAEKRWVKFGVSPFGIWRPGVPATIEAQLDAYAQLYADARLWMHEGWGDYFTPQLYWSISPAKQSFPVLLKWWAAENKAGRHMWPGISSARIGPERPATEMVNQIALTREVLGADPGHIHWSFKALKSNQGGVADLMKSTSYTERALVPASPWLGQGAPAAPRIAPDGDGVSIKSEKTSGLRWWVVQEKVGDRWNLRVVPSTATRVQRTKDASAIAVRAVDVVGNASAPAVLQ